MNHVRFEKEVCRQYEVVTSTLSNCILYVNKQKSDLGHFTRGKREGMCNYTFHIFLGGCDKPMGLLDLTEVY